MPKVTIWIRKEDEAKWQAIKDKPEWLHKVIQLGALEYERLSTPVMTTPIITTKSNAERISKSVQEHKTYFKKDTE